jgi:hypothetical protein
MRVVEKTSEPPWHPIQFQWFSHSQLQPETRESFTIPIAAIAREPRDSPCRLSPRPHVPDSCHQLPGRPTRIPSALYPLGKKKMETMGRSFIQKDMETMGKSLNDSSTVLSWLICPRRSVKFAEGSHFKRCSFPCLSPI